jgi:Fe-S-cluster containining protein
MESSVSPTPTVQVDFTLGVGSGRLNASLQVPSGDVTLTQLLPILQTLTSNIVDSAAQIADTEGYTISCRAGCGACCRQLVPLSIFEAEALAQWIHTLPQEQQLALKARFHTALSALRDAGILARITSPYIWDENNADARTLAADYHAQKIPCPFLDNESCSIHPIRPLICREYLVTSPPEFCSHPTRETVVPLPIPLKTSTALFGLGSLVEANTNGWIPLVFLFAWMQSGAQPGNAITGPGPEVLYEFVKRLSS